MSQAPKPQLCHACGHSFAGSHCPICKEPRPAYLALKRIAALVRKVTPLRDPQACRYFPKSICGCSGRGTCLPAA